MKTKLTIKNNEDKIATPFFAWFGAMVVFAVFFYASNDILWFDIIEKLIFFINAIVGLVAFIIVLVRIFKTKSTFYLSAIALTFWLFFLISYFL